MRFTTAFRTAFAFGFCLTLFALASRFPTAAQTGAKNVPLTAQERGKLSVFLSNFSEINMNPFSRGRITDAELIQFGVLHRLWNAPMNSAPHYEPLGGGKRRLLKSSVDSACLYFFGRKPSRHFSIRGYTFDGKGYRDDSPSGNFELGVGDPVNFTSATKMRSLGEGEYEVIATECSGHDWWKGYPQAPVPPAKKNRSEEEMWDYSVGGPRRVVVKRITSGGESRYILLEYGREQ